MNRCRLSNITIAFHITIVFALTCILVTLLHDLKNNVDLKRNPSMLEKRNNILDFGRQWCRLEKWRHDWEGLLGECSREMAWEKRNTTFTDRTSAGKSYISSWELSPIGHFSRFWIQSVNVKGELKNHGGDAWRVYIQQGPASLTPVVFDHQDGRYEVLFLITEPGVYKAEISLDYTLCDGFRDPPEDWFIIGTIQGKYQKDGVLGYIGDDYILKPLGERHETSFIIENTTTKISQGFFEYCRNYSEGVCTSYKKPIPSCQNEGIAKCALLWNGHGQWIKNQWKPYFTGFHEKSDSSTSSSVRRSGMLWLYGDSVNSWFHGLARGRPLCTEIFNDCKESYNWIYQVNNVHEGKTKFDGRDFDASIILNQIHEILSRTEMNHEDSAFVFNMGAHYPASLNFTTFKALVHDVIQLLLASDNASGSRDMTNESRDTSTPTRGNYRNKKFKADFIWRTTSAIQKEKLTKIFVGTLNLTSIRFYTYQRVHLFQLYANSAMCEAGLPLLDVYPLTAAYPPGTLDAVHFDTQAFVPVAEALEEFFGAKKNADKVYFNLVQTLR